MSEFRSPNPNDSMADHAEQHGHAYEEMQAIKAKLEDLPEKTHTHDMSHTHNEYADADALADHLANHPSEGDGGSYDDTEVRGLIQDNTDALEGKADTGHTHEDGEGYDDTALKGRVSQNETDISKLNSDLISTNQNVSANSTAIDGKASTSHLHPEHAPVVHGHNDLATKEELTQGLATKSPTTHTHPAPTGFWGMWKGTQAEFDELSERSDKTLYVVI